MIINSGTIREAFQSFNTVFNKAFHEMEAQYPRVAMEVPSETRDENYAWLGAVPSMREWIGDREIKNLAAYGYTIRNKDFEATVTVPRNDLEDDCIGVYKPVFQDLAYSARKHPDKLVFGCSPVLLRRSVSMASPSSAMTIPLPLLDIRPRRKVTKELTNLYRKATGQLVLK